MSVSLCPLPKMQFFTNTGDVAAGYYLYTYQAGLPGVPKPTYTDSTGTVYNTDPIVLDSAGRASIWLDGYYYMELWSGDKTVAGSTKLWDQDNVSSSGTSGTSTTLPWVDASSYASLSDALTAIGTTEVTLVISNTQIVTTNTTIPSTISVKVLKPGAFVIAASKTLTINGAFDCGLFQCFDASASGSSVVFGSGSVEAVYPEWWGAVADGVTNCTTPFIKALAAYGTIKLSPGTYSGYISVRKSNVSIIGAGSGVTTIKTPAGVNTNVLEVGETYWTVWPPLPLTSVTIKGLTLDGNKTNVPAPVSDVTGWGLPVTNTPYLVLHDIAAKNCWNGGFGIFIDSNYGKGTALYVENCGVGYGAVTQPGFDINSCSHGNWSVVTKDCKNGIRVLDNCNNNTLTGVIKNATDTGFLMGCTDGNTMTGGVYNVTIESGCQYQGVSIGGDVRAAILNVTVRAVAGIGFYVIKQALPANNSSGNIFNVTTKDCGNQGAILGGDSSILNHVSYTDGLTGAQGSWYATTISGNYNTVTTKIVDSATWQIRGISLLSGATSNVIAGYTRNDANTGLISDSGTGTRWCMDTYLGADVASPADGYLILPFDGSAFKITGTNAIAHMHPVSAFGRTGKEITLLFQGILTVYDSDNLKLNGNFVTAAGAVLKLVYDGSNWYETGRVLT